MRSAKDGRGLRVCQCGWLHVPARRSRGHSNIQPLLVVNFVIALEGIFPSHA